VKRGGKNLLMAHNFVNSFEWSLVGPFLPLFFYEIAHNSFFLLNLVNSLPSIVAVVMGLVWARISDAVGRRKPFVILSGLTGIATTFALAHVNNVYQLLMVRLAGVFTGSAGGAAFSALLAKTFKEKRGRYVGIYNALGLVGGIMGNVLSAYLYERLGMRGLLEVLAVGQAVPLAMVLAIEEEPEERKPLELSNILAKPKFPREFWRVYAVRSVLVLPGLFGGSVLAVYFVKYLGGSEQLWALVTAVCTLLGLSSIPYGELADRLGARKMFTLAGLGWAVLYAGYYLSNDPLTFAAFFIVPIWPAFHVTYQKVLMDLSDKSERASLFASERLVSTVYGLAVGLIAGYLADALSPRTLLAISSLLALCGAIVSYSLLKK